MRFKENKTSKYGIEVKGISRVYDLQSNFRIQIENELTYLKEDHAEQLLYFRLRELSYDLLEYDDPIARQIVEVSNLVSGIYTNLEIGVTRYGKIRKILNHGEVKEKWEKVKKELTNNHPLTSYEIIRAKEFEMSHPDMETKNIQFIHFIHVYFFLLGRENENGIFRTDEMDRFGNGIILPTSIKYAVENIDIQKEKRTFKGTLLKEMDVVNRLREAVKDATASANYNMNGEYICGEDAIEEADFTLTQEIGENYYIHNYIALKLKKDG